ncbi:hypothetical protein ACFWFI_04525 [Streptomyces sp. NPDC060209]
MARHNGENVGAGADGRAVPPGDTASSPGQEFGPLGVLWGGHPLKTDA